MLLVNPVQVEKLLSLIVTKYENSIEAAKYHFERHRYEGNRANRMADRMWRKNRAAREASDAAHIA